MLSGVAFGLVRELPFVAVIAQPQQFSFAAQLLAGQIVERVDFVRGRRFAAKAQFLQLVFQRFQIGNEELDFDFLRVAMREV